MMWPLATLQKYREARRRIAEAEAKTLVAARAYVESGDPGRYWTEDDIARLEQSVPRQWAYIAELDAIIAPKIAQSQDVSP